MPGSGNNLLDRMDREDDNEMPEDYCTDCKKFPCQCDRKHDEVE